MAAENNLSKGQWEQIPLIHTPKEVHGIAHDLLREDHPHLGGMYADGSGNDLRYRGENKESAAGECDKACRLAHEHLPHGSHVVEYRRATTHPDRFTNHFVHQIPTTSGMYTVDYTQRQFNDNAKFPVVEPTEKYETRKSMKPYTKKRDVDSKVL
jgi:hypothetical protein